MRMNQKHLICLVLLIFAVYSCFSEIIESRNDCPVTIFYGLNESHSNDWAQCTDSGVIGISYYDKESQNLIYKTMLNDDTATEEIITTGLNLEVSILLYDSSNNPHIFIAQSDSVNQTITHFFKINNSWNEETVIDFMNEGGQFIYELSGDIDNNNQFHLLVLKTRSNPDSDDYYLAFANAHLYYVNNIGNNWHSELVNNYNTIWTLDEYAKMMNRIDIKVDSNEKAHIVFGEQVNAMSSFSPSRLCYANNINGTWETETAVDYNQGTRDDAGWFPSLCLDNNNNPSIACSYIARVSSGSAIYSKLLYVKKVQPNSWEIETVCMQDDGYYGSDGRNYTGALNHLIIDQNNVSHILFSDIASSHAGLNYWNLGNIRYAVRNNDGWDITRIYQQPLPNGFFNATEMYDMCLLISNNPFQIQLMGQELLVTSNEDYYIHFVHFMIENANNNNELILKPQGFINYPNPFNPTTTFQYTLNKSFKKVIIEIYNIKGQLVKDWILGNQKLLKQEVVWNGNDKKNKPLASGVYFASLKADNQLLSIRKCLLIK